MRAIVVPCTVGGMIGKRCCPLQSDNVQEEGRNGLARRIQGGWMKMFRRRYRYVRTRGGAYNVLYS